MSRPQVAPNGYSDQKALQRRVERLERVIGQLANVGGDLSGQLPTPSVIRLGGKLYGIGTTLVTFSGSSRTSGSVTISLAGIATELDGVVLCQQILTAGNVYVDEGVVNRSGSSGTTLNVYVATRGGTTPTAGSFSNLWYLVWGT